MPRARDQHLNQDETEALVSEEISGVQNSEFDDTDRNTVRRHISSCVACKDLLARHVLATTTLSRLRMNDVSSPGPHCATEAEWLRVAAGSLPPEQTEQRLQHAEHCGHCGPLLRSAAEIFADDHTPEEKALIEALPSAQPDGQRALAMRLAGSPAVVDLPIERRLGGRSPSRLIPRFVFSFAALLLLAIVVWFVAKPQPQREADRLLATAYTQQRTIELRIPGADYAPTRIVRGTDANRMSRPTALLEAEALVAKHLHSRPDDAAWLHAEGLADLLEGNYDSAVSSLDRAHRLAPENPQTALDLATAFVSRADQSGSPADYGTAVELLSEILAKNPKDQLALFNRAIAQERIFAYQQAKEDWLAFLRLDSTSAWADEARNRLAELELRIRKQSRRSGTSLLDPAAFVGALDETSDVVDSIDAHAETYMELALEEWLPQAFSQDSVVNKGSSRMALNALAQLLVSRHKDPWLGDFLERLDKSSDATTGRQFLTDALRTSKTADLDRTRTSARAAENAFRQTRNRAGLEMAVFEEIYANQLEHQSEPCFRQAETMLREGQVTSYPWLHIQVLLESAACDTLSDEEARRRAAKARDLATKHGYPALRLRATGFLAGLYQIMGDSAIAWKYYIDGLAQFYAGDYAAMRGYNLFAGLDLVAQENQQWFLDVRLIQEALEMLLSNPDLALTAVEQQRLAEALLATGDLQAAQGAFQEAHDLLLQTADNDRKEYLWVETQIWLANVQLLKSAPQEAVRQLEAVRERVTWIPDKDLAFDFFRTSGLAHLALADNARARPDLKQALLLAEESLKLNSNERERLIWSRKTDSTYRGMVALDLSDDVDRAFSRWEWYKGASLRGFPSADEHRKKEASPSEFQDANSRDTPLPEGTALISYAVFQEGTAVWVDDGQTIREQWISMPKKTLDSMAKLFAEHCSRQDSSVEKLKNEGGELYQVLISPIAGLLSPYGRVIIEPDDQLWLVPFQALVDPTGHYFGDRFAISFSPGLAYLSFARPWKGVTSDSRALIVGDPETDNWAPLPEAEEEAKGIASQFRYTHLLLRGDATFENVVAGVGDADVFHFSGHATASPRGVGLVLQNSTLLSAERFGPKAFEHSQLVVLSACSSANGGAGVFSDQDSVARSIMSLRVPAIVASRWMVDSRATSVLMQRFYHRMLDGAPVSEAFANAARDLRGQVPYAHPFYWASFSVFGKG